MTDKEIQKLSRKQLLKIMLNQSMRIDELESELEIVKKELDNYKSDAKITAESQYLVEQAMMRAKQAVESFFEEKSKKADISENQDGVTE